MLKGLTKEQINEALIDLPDSAIEQLMYDWQIWARDSQLLPVGDWLAWLIIAGRGWGKTRTGAETIRQWQSEGVMRMALVGQTPAEVRDVMIEGESGILAISPPWNKPVYKSTQSKVCWNNGAVAHVYSAENPEVLRGPQHEKAWIDELAKFRYAQDTWDNTMFGLRLGDNPQVIITTTPRPTKTLKSIMTNKTTVITKGTTYENKANLPLKFFENIVATYESTRLGRQELYAEILGDTPGALWTRNTIDNSRVSKLPELKRIVVAIDPSTTSNADSDEAGIIVGGLGVNNEGYVLEDYTIKASPAKWAKIALTAYYKWKADRIVGEANNGGDMIETIIKSYDVTASYKKVWASRGKIVRAEPISSLYEQGRIHHLGYHEQLEDELCEYVPGAKSPNRLDAMVWAMTELMGVTANAIRTLSKQALGL